MATLDLSKTLNVDDDFNPKEVIEFIKTRIPKKYKMVSETDTELQIKSNCMAIPRYQATFSIKHNDTKARISLNAKKWAGWFFYLFLLIGGIIVGGIFGIGTGICFSFGVLISYFVQKPLKKFKEVFNITEKYFDERK